MNIHKKVPYLFFFEIYSLWFNTGHYRWHVDYDVARGLRDGIEDDKSARRVDSKNISRPNVLLDIRLRDAYEVIEVSFETGNVMILLQTSSGRRNDVTRRGGGTRAIRWNALYNVHVLQVAKCHIRRNDTCAAAALYNIILCIIVYNNILYGYTLYIRTFIFTCVCIYIRNIIHVYKSYTHVRFVECLRVAAFRVQCRVWGRARKKKKIVFVTGQAESRERVPPDPLENSGGVLRDAEKLSPASCHRELPGLGPVTRALKNVRYKFSVRRPTILYSPIIIGYFVMRSDRFFFPSFRPKLYFERIKKKNK